VYGGLSYVYFQKEVIPNGGFSCGTDAGLYNYEQPSPQEQGFDPESEGTSVHDALSSGRLGLRQLVGQNAGVSDLEITDSNIKSFDRVAQKYRVDYAVKKDRSVSPPKYLVFFKAWDADALTAACTEFTAKTVNRAKKPSIFSRLRKFKEAVKTNVVGRVKHKEQERTR
jgi:hypothetical protein